MLSFYLSTIGDEPSQDKFTAIYEMYYPTMLKIAAAVLKDQTLAEDAVHETFLYILKILKNIENPASLQTKVLVRKSVYHISLNLCRTGKQDRKVVQALESETLLTFPDQEDIVSELESMECLNGLKRMILNLPPEDRELLQLFYFAKMRAEDIGELLGISRKTVYNRVHAITRKLNEQMREEDLLD